MLPASSVMLKRKIKSLPFRGKVAIALSFMFSFLTYGYVFHYMFLKNHISEESFLEKEKCPLCFGQSLCADLKRKKANFQGFTRLQFLNALANLKNVNYGDYRGYPVVFKKLAHNSELDEFDSKYFGPKDLTFLSLLKDVTVNEIKGLSDFTNCPSSRLIDKILIRYQEMADAVDLSYPEKVQLATTLMINPEPVILQTFPKSEGWPFPRYHGACGRFVVVENTGKSLSEFYKAAWAERVSLALQILRIADKLTTNHGQFSLYLTDVCYDNFAVDEDGHVTVIDLENIFVVDTWHIKQNGGTDWDEPYLSEFDECKTYGDCLTVHSDLLCSRAKADFNYYTVCRNLLSGYASEPGKPDGLLHGTPDKINKKYNIDWLLKQCAKPDHPATRFDIKDKLLKVLDTIKKEVF